MTEFSSILCKLIVLASVCACNFHFCSLVISLWPLWAGNDYNSKVLIAYFDGFRCLFLLIQFMKLLGIDIINTEIVCFNVACFQVILNLTSFAGI